MVDTDDTQRTTDDGRQTTPRVWHKLPTGELKILKHTICIIHVISDLLVSTYWDIAVHSKLDEF